MPKSDEKIAALIVAAGTGSRVGGDVPKQFQPLAGKPVLARSVEAFLRHPAISQVHIVVAPGEEGRARDALQGLADQLSIGPGGKSRQESVYLGLKALAVDEPRKVLVHDAARPLVSQQLITRLIEALDEYQAACPALPVVDSVRRGTDLMGADVNRENLWRVQTPQGFEFSALLKVHEQASEGATDDAMLVQASGIPVRMIKGEERALKITVPEDFDRAHSFLQWSTLVGQGFDVHRFCDGDHLWLCGVRIPHEASLAGHSDADVALHALTDAILGALGDGDIGTHFPPSDPKWKGAASDQFLAHAAEKVAAAGGKIVHCDVTIIAEAPKVGPYREQMCARLAEILSGHAPRLSLKATTTEGLGFAGRREGIACMATATIQLPLGIA